jgi:hypothetical protein
VLYDCLTHEKPGALPTYLWLFATLTHLASAPDTSALVQLKLLLAYYRHCRPRLQLCGALACEPLLSAEVVASVESALSSLMENIEAQLDLKAALRNFASGTWSGAVFRQARWRVRPRLPSANPTDCALIRAVWTAPAGHQLMHSLSLRPHGARCW